MNQINNLMEKEMSRKEFLATLGFGVASILGFSTILKFLFNKGQGQQVGKATGPLSYGANVYGGQKR
jgi:hypothetical protein